MYTVSVSLCCDSTKVLGHTVLYYCNKELVGMYISMCSLLAIYTHNYWPLPSNQSFYRQIAGYVRGVRDPRVGQ